MRSLPVTADHGQIARNIYIRFPKWKMDHKDENMLTLRNDNSNLT